MGSVVSSVSNVSNPNKDSSTSEVLHTVESFKKLVQGYCNDNRMPPLNMTNDFQVYSSSCTIGLGHKAVVIGCDAHYKANKDSAPGFITMELMVYPTSGKVIPVTRYVSREKGIKCINSPQFEGYHWRLEKDNVKASVANLRDLAISLVKHHGEYSKMWNNCHDFVGAFVEACKIPNYRLDTSQAKFHNDIFKIISRGGIASGVVAVGLFVTNPVEICIYLHVGMFALKTMQNCGSFYGNKYGKVMLVTDDLKNRGLFNELKSLTKAIVTALGLYENQDDKDGNEKKDANDECKELEKNTRKEKRKEITEKDLRNFLCNMGMDNIVTGKSNDDKQPVSVPKFLFKAVTGHTISTNDNSKPTTSSSIRNSSTSGKKEFVCGSVYWIHIGNNHEQDNTGTANSQDNTDNTDNTDNADNNQDNNNNDNKKVKWIYRSYSEVKAFNCVLTDTLNIKVSKETFPSQLMIECSDASDNKNNEDNGDKIKRDTDDHLKQLQEYFQEVTHQIHKSTNVVEKEKSLRLFNLFFSDM